MLNMEKQALFLSNRVKAAFACNDSYAIIDTMRNCFTILWGDIMDSRWLSVEEIGEYLGVSKDTVYAWISKRNMPAHRIGRFWKFKPDEVDEWVRSGGAVESGSR